MNFEDAKIWLADPAATYKALHSLVISKVGQFNERQRQIPILEKQVLAIRLAAEKLNSSSLRSIYLRERAALDREIGTVWEMQEEISGGLQAMQKIRQSILDHIPGSQFALGGPEAWIVPIAIVVTVLYALNRLDNFIKMHDGSVARVKQALQEVADMEKKGQITAQQAAEMRDYIAKNGGLPNPNALSLALAGFGTTIGIILVAYWVLKQRRIL